MGFSVTNSTLIKMWVRGLLFLLLIYSTYVYCTLIPNKSLVMSTHKGLLYVYPGLQDRVNNDVINNDIFTSIGSGLLYNTRGISFIHRENRKIVIFSDAGFKTISAINVTSPTPQAIILHIGTSSGVGELAVDWVSGNCYWVDAVYGWIVMQAIPKDLSRFNSLNPNFKMVIDTYLDIPTGIAVYPELGYLFWTDTGKIPKIERSSLTGKDRKLLTWQGVIRPTSLCIDYSIDRLYWTDPARGTVEYSDLHGDGRKVLVSNPGSSFYGIDIFETVLVVSEWSYGYVNGSIKLFSMADSNQANDRQAGPSITIPGTPVFSLSVFDDRRQPLDLSQRCDTRGCQQLCIEKPNSTGADCACEDGYKLDLDGTTCTGRFTLIDLDTGTHSPVSSRESRQMVRRTDNQNFDLNGEGTSKEGFFVTECQENNQVIGRGILLLIGQENKYNFALLLSCAASEIRVLQRKIVYTNTNKICFVSINAITTPEELLPEVDCTVVNSINNITRFTIDTHNSTFYFTDGRKIYHQRAFSIDGSQEIYSTSREIIDLAYDSRTGAVYWFERNVSGGVCYKIAGQNSTQEEITKTLTKPITMTFDPYTQQLFWMALDTMDSKVRLYTIGPDGRTVIIASPIIQAPIDLEYDWSTRRLVWTDNGFMGQMNSNGTNERKIELNVTRKYHSLTVFKNYTIIGYSVPNRPNEAAFTVVQDGGTVELINFQVPNMKRVDEVKVYDEQLLEIEPCEKNNGGCEQICLPGKWTTCGCYVGYTLNGDNKTCSTGIVPQDFILAIDSIDHNAYQISMDGKNINALRLVRGNGSKSIDYDATNQRIVWIDQSERRIQHFKLSGVAVKAENKDDITQYSHVAIDVSTGNFYVTLNNKIAVIDPEFDVKILLSTSQTPGKLKVFPKIGQMVWVEGSKIRKAKMDGTDSNDFVTQGISTPSDIALDYEGEALYWCDRTLDKIARTELMMPVTIVIVSKTGEQPNNIYVAGQYLYYTSYINTRAVYRRYKNNGQDFTTIFDSPLIGGLASLFVYQNPQSALHEECSVANGRCCKFCLPLNKGKKCACAEGSSLNIDGRTCSLEMECPLSIANAELEGTCLPCYNRHCSFTCNHGFKMTVTGSALNCGSLGQWNYSNEVCKPDGMFVSELPSYIIIAAAAGSSGFLLVVAVIAFVCFRRNRSNRVPRELRELNKRRKPIATPRVDKFKQEELEEEYDYIDDCTLHHEGANGQTPAYLELSESQRDYEKLSEKKNPYNQKIICGKRSSETVHDDYLTPSMAGSLKEGLNDRKVSLPEEDNHGYLRSSSEDFRRGSSSSEVSTRYQPWDMFEQQVRESQIPRASNPVRYYPDGRSVHYGWSQRY